MKLTNNLPIPFSDKKSDTSSIKPQNTPTSIQIEKNFSKVVNNNKIQQDEKYANRISTDILSKLTE